ncbi:hypothetical protein BH11PSE11_BH11PSE11_26570 [soil metagenome]
MDLYIYYRVPIANIQALQERVVDMQSGITRDAGITTSLKRRRDEKDGCQTWMEVYIEVLEDFETELDFAVQNAGLMKWIAGDRHTEHFVDLPACA